MIIINWNESLKIGHPQIDEQHKKLFEFIEKINTKKCLNRDELKSVLRYLKSYTIMHFSFEENLMKRGGYQDFAAHKELHDSIKRKLDVYEKELLNGIPDTITPEYLKGLSDFLSKWLSKHIYIEDRKIKDTLK